MRNAGLDEAQAGIKIAGRNINNLRYAKELMLLNCGAREDSWESLEQEGNQTSQS